MSAHPGLWPESNRFRARVGTIIIPTDPYWVQCLEAVIRANRALNDELVILQPAATHEELLLIPPESLVDQVLAHSLDVLICTVVNQPFLDALSTEHLPVICLAELDYERPGFTAVTDLYEGGHMAGQYIAEEIGGQGEVMCIMAGLEGIPVWGEGRMRGFQDALAPYPNIHVHVVPSYWSYARAYPQLLQDLANFPAPLDAIFGISDTIIMAARDAGRVVGVVDDHTLLVGLNGDPMALTAVAAGELSATIDISSEQLGAAAMQVAHDVALGKPQPSRLIQPFQLITRENIASIATRKLVAIADIPSRMVGYNPDQENERLSQLKISMEITRQIGSLLERNRLAKVISSLIHQHYGYEWMRILRWSAEDQKLVHYEGSLSPASSQVPVEQDPLLYQVFGSNEPVVIPDTLTSRRWHSGKEWAGIRARAVLPIRLGESVIGVLDLQSARPVRQASLETVGLNLLAGQLGIAIQNADLYLDALQAREVAERANQLKTRFVANVGHEMRTPLNAVLGFSQSILKKLDQTGSVPPEELRGDIQHIYKSGEHLMYMINDLLDLSRAEIGALSLYFEPLVPGPFLEELFQNFAQAEDGASPELTWTLCIPEHLPVIRADTVRMRQVLNNLLANARKYTTRGSITLGADIQLPYLHLWVADTGEGVPIDVQEKIFEPFSTVSRRRRKEGIGLGLSITRHLVGLHGGLITLESQEGQGSTFHVYLPLPGIQPQPAETPEVPSRQRSEHAILLVVSSQGAIPEEVRALGDHLRLTPYVVSDWEGIKRAFADARPAAIAWDMASVSSREWSLIYHICNRQNDATLPAIFYRVEAGSGCLSSGLTQVVFKPQNGNTMKDWFSSLQVDASASSPILVVDDDPQARAYYEDLLRREYPNARILQAENGARALDLLHCEVPALILLDLMMPEVDGFGVLEQVRADPRTQRVPVVVISGKLLDYEDVQRLNHHKTLVYTKQILDAEETAHLFDPLELEARLLPQPTSLIIKQALAFLHQNYALPITRKDVADAAGVSANYLSQIFRQEMTISPWDYLNRLRIQRAKELLLCSSDSITRIASAVGYNDSAYFSRVFHKQTGQSPQEFRLSHT